MDSLSTMAGKIVNYSVSQHGACKEDPLVTEGLLYARSNIVSVRSLQRCPCIETNVWPIDDQWLKGRKIRSLASSRLREGQSATFWTNIFGEPPVLERIKNDQGFISAVESETTLVLFSNRRCEDLPPTVVGRRVNKVRSCGGEIASVNPLRRPDSQYSARVGTGNK